MGQCPPIIPGGVIHIIKYVILDMSKGKFTAYEHGNVTGISKEDV